MWEHQISWGGQRSPAALKQAKDDETKDDAHMTASERMVHDVSYSLYPFPSFG